MRRSFEQECRGHDILEQSKSQFLLPVVENKTNAAPSVSLEAVDKMAECNRKRKLEQNDIVCQNKNRDNDTDLTLYTGRELAKCNILAKGLDGKDSLQGNENQLVTGVALRANVHKGSPCTSEYSHPHFETSKVPTQDPVTSKSINFKESAWENENHIKPKEGATKSRNTVHCGEKERVLLRVTGGCFDGVVAFFVTGGVSQKRLQVWKSRFQNFGGSVVESIRGSEKILTHVFASDQVFLAKEGGLKCLHNRKDVIFMKYEWIEECLKHGKTIPSESYYLPNPFSFTNHFPCLGTHKRESISGKPITEYDISVSENGMENLNVEKDAENIKFSYNCIEEGHNFRESRIIPDDFNVEEKLSGIKYDVEQIQMNSKIGLHMLARHEPPDLNKHITSILREMWHIYEDVIGDEWRSLTYRKACTQIEKLPYMISCYEDVKNIYGIGDSMAEKIKEIVGTGRLQKLESLKSDPQVQIVQKFVSVWGIGPRQAQKLYQAGYREVEELLKDSSLSHMARIGVQYYHDLILRIPREEVENAEKYIQEVSADICPGIWIKATGSFRRGLATCGDIDILVTHPDGYSHRGFLVKLVQEMKGRNVITDGLHCSDHSSEGSRHKVDTFMGICLLPEHHHHRRIDIKVYPSEAYAFALVYFTGNDVLNRKLRYAAQRKGYKLNDQGLFVRIGGKKGTSSEVSIPCQTEEEVFNILDFRYCHPHERNW